jgi:hypothetical protein
VTDIASLGIRVDSSQTVAATSALGGLAAAAKPAAAAADNLSKSHAGLSTQAMAAQHSIRSMVEGIALGMPPTQVLTQQLNHLSYAASGPGGISAAFKQAVGSVTSILSPTALVVGGIAAVAGGAYLAVSSVAAMAKAFDDAARTANTTTDALHGLQQAAAFKGIDQADFLKAMDHFGGVVYDAQHNMGQLAEIFRANGQSAKTFTGYLQKAADLIKNAGSDQQRLQLLQQMGLPATMDWVRFLSQGGDAIKRAADEAVKFNESAEGKMVAKAREFDEAWSKTWSNFSNGAKSAIIEAASFFDTYLNPAKLTDIYKNALREATGKSGVTAAQLAGGNKLGNNSDVSGLYNGLGSNAPGNAATASKPTVDPNVLKNQIALEQQHIGLLGQMASASDAVRSVELQVQAARLNGVQISDAQVASLKRLAAEQSIGVTAIKASTDAQRIEAQTVGMSIGQAAQYAAAQNAINDAKRAGRPLTAENIAQINAEASALGQAAQNADNLKFAFTNLVQGPMQTFVSALQQGATVWDAFKKAGQSALNSIASKLADMAASNLWSAAFGGSGGGLGSLFGLLGGAPGVNAAGGINGAVGATSVGGAPLVAALGFHSGAGPGDAATFKRYVHPAYFDNAPRFHSGIGPGEQAAIIRKDESVLTPGQMKAMGGGGAPSVTINQYNTFTGNDPQTEARMRQQITQSKDAAVREAVAAVSGLKSTSPGFLRASR